MKTGAALLLSTLLAALCASSVRSNGVCYDPNHVGPGKNAASVAADIEAMKSKGFTYVRTYISKFGNTDMVKQLAASGLQVAAGAPYGQGDYSEQIAAAIAAAKGGNVVYIFIGNENLAGAASVPPGLIAEIKRVKGEVPGVKVGTVQRNTEFLINLPGLKDLIDACDVIGVNIHPFFTGGQTDASTAMELTKKHWNQALSLAGNKLVLGETGWPSDGEFAGNRGTPAFASAYFSAYKSWSSAIAADKKFYFQMFDQPYKPEAYEKMYGIVTSDSQDKFGASVPSQTAAPVATPAPTTAPTIAPTTAPTATESPLSSSSSSNSTSSSSSSSDKEAGGSGSTTGSLSDAGVENLTKDGSSTTSSTETGAEAEGTFNFDPSVRSSVDTPVINGSDNTKSAGGSTNEANTQSDSGGSSGGVAVAFAVAAGCVAVVAAFGFIYRTRQKARELEDEESKLSFAVTPHGGCVL